VAREVGSFDMALAVGFLFAAWRPVRAWGLLPLVAALVACLALTSVIDLTEGKAAAFSESVHLLDVLGLWLLWQLGRVSGGAVRERLTAA
jgi:predicted anti-sigma-YlaC factor YlaD